MNDGEAARMEQRESLQTTHDASLDRQRRLMDERRIRHGGSPVPIGVPMVTNASFDSHLSIADLITPLAGRDDVLAFAIDQEESGGCVVHLRVSAPLGDVEDIIQSCQGEMRAIEMHRALRKGR